VAGNATVAAAVNSSLYYILSSVREDWPYGTSPGGLASDSYDGRSFWDAETWMFPPVDLLHPGLGWALLRYRLDRLPAARARAVEYGYEGAMFPWTSELSGVDDTAGNLGHLEQHITGDVAMAVRLHWRAAGDAAQLAQAWPLLRGACEFWAGRLAPTAWSAGNATVLGAVGPDESSGPVDGDAYTVAVAAATLDFCAEAAVALGREAELPPAWAALAARPFLPSSTSLAHANGSAVHLQYHGWPAAGKPITQSSVALLQYPLGSPAMAPAAARADLRYYENLTRHNGFFTGDSIYSIAWLALGERAAADAQWQAAFAHQDLGPGGFNVWREELDGGHSNFITGAGGFLQNVVNGYAGVRIGAGGVLRLRPALPLWGVTGIALRELHFRGRRLTVGFDAARLTLLVVAQQPSGDSDRGSGGAGAGGAAAGWVLDAAGVNHTLAVGVQLELPVQPVQLWLAMADAARE